MGVTTTSNSAVTYTEIQTYTLSGSQSSVTFSTIPSTYTDLVLVAQCGASANDNLAIRLNSDSTNNYSYTNMNGTGSNVYSGRASNQNLLLLDNTAYAQNNLSKTTICNIMNYTNSTTYKTLIYRSSTANLGVDAMVGLWRSTAAINSITLSMAAGNNIITGSTFTLYGIKAA